MFNLVILVFGSFLKLYFICRRLILLSNIVTLMANYLLATKVVATLWHKNVAKHGKQPNRTLISVVIFRVCLVHN